MAVTLILLSIIASLSQSLKVELSEVPGEQYVKVEDLDYYQKQETGALKIYVFDEVSGDFVSQKKYGPNSYPRYAEAYLTQDTFAGKIIVIQWYKGPSNWNNGATTQTLHLKYDDIVFNILREWGCSCYEEIFTDIFGWGDIFTFVGTAGNTIFPEFTYCNIYEDDVTDYLIEPRKLSFEITFPIKTNAACQNTLVWIEIKYCDRDVFPQPTDIQLQIKGNEGLTDFVYLGSLGRQSNIRKGYVDILKGKDIGDIYSFTIKNTVTSNFCMTDFKINVPSLMFRYKQKQNYTFGENYLRNSEYYMGVILSSECAFSYHYMLYVNYNDPNIVHHRYIACMDKLELNVGVSRAMYAVDIHTCADAEPLDPITQQNYDLYLTIMGKTLGHNSYTTTDIVYLDSNNVWQPDTHRRYIVNSKETIGDISLVSVGLVSNQDITLCIDSIQIRSEMEGYVAWNSVLHLSHNWIGGQHESSNIYGIFKYPVCKTEVVGVTIDYENSASQLDPEDSTISGLSCKNNNKMISSTCSISQSYEMTTATSFAISKESSTTSEYSWGSASSVMTGITNSESTTTSNEFAWGLSQEIGAETEFNVLGQKVKASVKVGAHQDWTESNEKSKSKDETTETTNETNEENTQSKGSSKGFEQTYETISTNTIVCSGEIQVPPSHSVDFMLVFSAFNTTIYTYTDLKLTLCSAFINENTQDNSHYIYLDNIPGIIQHKEVTSCTVDFQSAKYLRNDIPCAQHQILALETGSNYVPKCTQGNPDLYDICQCDIGDGRTLGQCWCTDEGGNIEPGTLNYIRDGENEEDICALC